MTELKPFKFWVQNVLPVVYDDSLSYYELLCKVVDYINKIIGNETQLGEAMVQLTELVNNFIDSADLEQIVEDKLNEMIESGELQEIIEEVFNEKGIACFDTFVAARNEQWITANQVFRTKGFYSVNDGGEGLYLVVNSNVLGSVPLFGNLYAVYFGEVRNIKSFGAKGSGVDDDTVPIKLALCNNYCHVYIPKGNFLVTDNIDVYSFCIVEGIGTIIDRAPTSETPTGCFEVVNVENVKFKGFTIKGNYGDADGYYRVYVNSIHCYNSENIIIDGCVFEDIDDVCCVQCQSCTDVYIKNCSVNRYLYAGFMAYMGNVNFNVINCSIKGLSNMTYQQSYPISLSAGDGYESTFTPTRGGSAIGNYIEADVPWWEGIDAHGGYDLVIKDNVIKGTAVGIAVFSMSGYACENVVVEGNVFEGVTDDTYVRAVSGDGIMLRCKNGIVANNIIKNASYQSSVEAGAIDIQGEDIIVSGNVIEKFNSIGIWIPAVEVFNITINNNTIVSDGSNVYGIGIRGGSKHNVMINNNIIKGSERGIGWIGSGISDDPDSYMVGKDNIIEATTYPYYNYAVWPTMYKSTPYMGKAGDIIPMYAMTSLPSNYPMAYLCTESATDQSAAVWVPIPQPTV